ncbi:MAG: phage tail sheath family protein [Caldilineaceae bacterium]|nr:phage tail sheath family protein [Caldilineaceae bacterium]
MALYDSKAPGVYIEEIPSGARPIQAVGTSTPGFVGVVNHPEAPLLEAVPINNWLDFVRKFRLDAAAEKRAADNALIAAQNALAEAEAFDDDTAAAQAAVDDATEAAAKADAYAKTAAQSSQSTPLTHAVYGFFQNGGTRCYVVNIGTAKGASLQTGLNQLKRVDEIAIVAAPGYTDLDAYSSVIGHCQEMKDRVAILDAPELAANESSDLLKSTATAKGKGMPPRSDYASFYFPWLKTRDPLFPANRALVNVPPSGHVAGIWARTDSLRGVHKAPANEAITGALDLTYHVTADEQGTLNQRGINCLRYFPDSGILVWGARTIASNPEWRYLNVRRLFNMIEKSIATSTRWIVFEPNDQTLWKAITRDVSAFLTRIWRTGALMGTTPEEAFFVKCDAETNPPEEIDAGKVNILIGIAPVKPAEFVVFQISQHQSGSQVEQ